MAANTRQPADRVAIVERALAVREGYLAGRAIEEMATLPDAEGILFRQLLTSVRNHPEELINFFGWYSSPAITALSKSSAKGAQELAHAIERLAPQVAPPLERATHAQHLRKNVFLVLLASLVNHESASEQARTLDELLSTIEHGWTRDMLALSQEVIRENVAGGHKSFDAYVASDTPWHLQEFLLAVRPKRPLISAKAARQLIADVIGEFEADLPEGDYSTGSMPALQLSLMGSGLDEVTNELRHVTNQACELGHRVAVSFALLTARSTGGEIHDTLRAYFARRLTRIQSDLLSAITLAVAGRLLVDKTLVPSLCRLACDEDDEVAEIAIDLVSQTGILPRADAEVLCECVASGMRKRASLLCSVIEQSIGFDDLSLVKERIDRIEDPELRDRFARIVDHVTTLRVTEVAPSER